MMKKEMFEENVPRRYSDPRPSFTYVFVILNYFFVFVLAFFFCLGADGGLWKRHGSYMEQPDVKFTYKFLMVLETSGESGQSSEIYVSTLDDINVIRPESYRAASIEFYEDDVDLDGKFDSFILQANVPISEQERVMSFQAVLFFDYGLKTRVKFDMEAVASTSFETTLPLSGFDSSGHLAMRQTNPLGVRDYVSHLYAEESPLVSTSTSNIRNVLEKYRERDVAADYVERYPIKSRAVPGESDNFCLKWKVDVPEQEVLYVPTLLEVLEDAWVKYLSILVVCWILLDGIKRLLFSGHP